MKEEKAKEYLQDLFDHMHNEHGLILTQSEMLEILCICGKEYDTVQFELGEIERKNKDLSSQLTAYKDALRELIEYKMSSDTLPEKDKYKLSNQSIDVIGCSNNEGSSHYPFFVYYDYDKNKWFSRASPREVKVISWMHFDLYKIKTLIKY